jgi:CRISPR-associated protein Csh2
MTQKIKNVSAVEQQVNNSDILFIYDAKMCNPNGDPDDENRPRMDYGTETNLVSDVRLKRYIRDYLEDKKENIFVGKVDEKTVDATQRLAFLAGYELKKSTDQKLVKKGEEILVKVKAGTIKEVDFVEHIDRENLLKAFIDVRLFGATMPIKGEKKGQSFTFTGPIQFNWGYSLNRVNLMESPTISSIFAGRTRAGEEEYGTFGKDYRVYYSLIAFHGIISGKRAEHTTLSINDIKLLEEALIKAIPLQATRSKIGQYPRLLIRVEYTDSETFIGDLRRYIKSEPITVPENKIRDISEIKLSMDSLIEKLGGYKDRINKIYYWQDKELTPQFIDLIKAEDLKKKLQPINTKEKQKDSELTSDTGNRE